jgi:hypothetical protein
MPFRCPWYQSGRTRRSKETGFFEASLAKLSVPPLRCERCDYRFFGKGAKLKSRTGSSISAGPFSALQNPPEAPAVSLPK